MIHTTDAWIGTSKIPVNSKDIKSMKTNVTVVLIFACLATSALAQDANKKKAAKKAQRDKILVEVTDVLEQWKTAFNAKDAEALSKLYDLKADVIYDDDVHHRSRKSLLKRFEEEFGKDGAVQQEITEVDRKILSPRIVVETGVWKNTGSTDKSRADRGRYSCILVKKKGKWLIVQDRGWAQPAKK